MSPCDNQPWLHPSYDGKSAWRSETAFKVCYSRRDEGQPRPATCSYTVAHRRVLFPIYLPPHTSNCCSCCFRAKQQAPPPPWEKYETHFLRPPCVRSHLEAYSFLAGRGNKPTWKSWLEFSLSQNLPLTLHVALSLSDATQPEPIPIYTFTLTFPLTLLFRLQE